MFVFELTNVDPLWLCSIEMCKEVVDGLRVIFDFSLGANLLYDAEKTQHKKIMSTFHPTGSVKRES